MKDAKYVLHGKWLWVPLAITLMSCAAYGWALRLPFIGDDYLQITLGRKYGSPGSWNALVADPLYRCRATSIVLTWLINPWARLQPLWYNVAGLALHVVNGCLIFSLGAWKRIGWPISAAAACFFSIYEGHQEAVVWYAALPELLVVFFVLLCVLFWILRHEYPGRARLWYAASLLAFVLALASKESAVAAVGLLALLEVSEFGGWKAPVRRLAPFVLLAALYFAADYAGRLHNGHYQDGTFALSAPFWLTLPRSFGRMIWVWGLASLVGLGVWRAHSRFPLIAISVCWMMIALLPYSFLTYMPVVPSRHTYMAAVGLSWIVAAAFMTLKERCGRRSPALILAALLVFFHNTSYLWMHKKYKYLERAEPTELLVQELSNRHGAVDVYCFPYGSEAADLAVSMRIGDGVRPRIAAMGRPRSQNASAVNLCGTALAREALRSKRSL